MEASWALAYWLYTVAHGFATVLGTLFSVVGFISLIVSGAAYAAGAAESDERAFVLGKKIFKFSVICWLIVGATGLIPSKQDMKTILALVVAETVAKNEKLGSIAKRSIAIIEKQLEKMEKEE